MMIMYVDGNEDVLNKVRKFIDKNSSMPTMVINTPIKIEIV